MPLIKEFQKLEARVDEIVNRLKELVRERDELLTRLRAREDECAALKERAAGLTHERESFKVRLDTIISKLSDL